MTAIKRILFVVVMVIACMSSMGNASAATTSVCDTGNTATSLNGNPNCPDTDTCTREYLTDERIPLAFRKDECVNADVCSLEYLTDERIPLEFRKDACGKPSSTEAGVVSSAPATQDKDVNSDPRYCNPGEFNHICMLPD